MTEHSGGTKRILLTNQDLLDATGSEDATALGLHFERIAGILTFVVDLPLENDEHTMFVGSSRVVRALPALLEELEAEVEDIADDLRDEAWWDDPPWTPSGGSPSQAVLQTFEDLLAATRCDSWAELAFYFDAILGRRDILVFEDEGWMICIDGLGTPLTFPATFLGILNQLWEHEEGVRELMEQMEPDQPAQHAADHDVRLRSGNLPAAGTDMDFDVKSDGKVLGTLSVSAGGLLWRPAHFRKKNGVTIDWETFDEWARSAYE